MSTLESTISMLRVMPEADVQIIFEMTKKLFNDQTSPFTYVSKEQILEDIDESLKQVESGKTVKAAEAISQLRTAYVLAMYHELQDYENTFRNDA